MYGGLVVDEAIIFDHWVREGEIQHPILVALEEVLFDHRGAFGLAAVDPDFILNKNVLTDTIRVVLQQGDRLLVFLKSIFGNLALTVVRSQDR